MKFLTIIGTRPNLIKVDAKLKQTIVFTGQHWDNSMIDLGLKLPKPKYSFPRGELGELIDKTSEVIKKEKPNYVIVFGDTNSALAGALATKQCRRKLIHIEAGMRCGNMEMIEEQNRIMIDHVSDILFCPSEREAKRLKAEDINATIIISGAPHLDTLFDQFPTKPIEEYKNFFLLTLHRAETVDNKEILQEVMEGLKSGHNIVWPIHPRTKKRIAEFRLKVPENIKIIEPLKYKKMVNLMASVKAILTDSGGIQPEAHFMRVPCITLRTETEWGQTVEQGWNRLVGTDKITIKRALDESFDLGIPRTLVYGDGFAKDKIRQYLESI